MRPPEVPGERLTTEGSFTPQELDALLVHQWRAIAAHHKTYAHLSDRGRRTAWEATKTLADLLVPQASRAFLRFYSDCRKRRQKGEWPVNRLFLGCELEMKRQRRLGRETASGSAGEGVLSRKL